MCVHFSNTYHHARCINSLRCMAPSIYNIHMCGVHANSLYRSSINFTKLYGIARKIATQRDMTQKLSPSALHKHIHTQIIECCLLFSKTPFDQSAFAENESSSSRMASYEWPNICIFTQTICYKYSPKLFI